MDHIDSDSSSDTTSSSPIQIIPYWTLQPTWSQTKPILSSCVDTVKQKQFTPDSTEMIDIKDIIDSYNNFLKHFSATYNELMTLINEAFQEMDRITPSFLNLPKIGQINVKQLLYEPLELDKYVYPKSENVLTLLELIDKDMNNKIAVLNELTKIDFQFTPAKEVIDNILNLYK